MSKLLIRDLRQVVSPAGFDAPLRGGALAELEMIEQGYVLCDGDRIEAVGPMSALGLVDSEIDDIDGSELCAIPGLVDCHTHPAFGGDRVAEFSLRAGTTTFEGKSGYGLDRETELASLRAVKAAGGVPTFLGAHATPPEFSDADVYLDFLLAEVLPVAAELAEAADVFLERGAFDNAQARRYL